MALPLSAQLSYRELCDRAVAAASVDSLSQAADYLRLAMKLEPDNPRNALLFSNLGTIQRRQQRYEDAIESYSYALNLAPHSIQILMNRASLYLELNKYDLARMDYSLVLDLERDNKKALLMRAYIYMQMRDYKSSRSDYKRLLKLAPFSYSARLGLATLARKEGEHEEALSILDKMLAEKQDVTKETDAERASLYIVRAGVEMDLQRAEPALADLEEAIRLDDSQAEAYLIRGQIYLSQKKKTLARKDFEKAMELGIPQSDMKELLMECK
ncbi:MAG: tetratricopeptide repeat protein [Bacteroides sp.]|nr:tetratricopeptide repeat protein [Bacteroides sp.]